MTVSNDTPPGAQRALSPSTPVRMPIERLVALIGAIVLAAVAVALWMNNVDRSLASVDKWMENVDARFERFEKAFGIAPPTAGHGSGSASKTP